MNNYEKKATFMNARLFNFIYKVIRKSLGRGRDSLLIAENYGVQMVPFNYYSPIPSVSDIENGWEAQMPNPFFEPELYDNTFMHDFLSNSLMPFASEFNPPTDAVNGEDEQNTSTFFWNNSQFSHSDAISLYCMVRHIKPKRVLEIGGGFSSLVIEQAMKKNGFGEIWEVEPYPRQFLRKIARISRFYETPIQHLPLSLFGELESGDILFIDSTHTVKTSSDCTYIYLKGFQRLNKGIWIHSHDIFLPDPYPREWAFEHGIFWTEQYLLQGILLNTIRFKVIYGSNYHRIFHLNLLKAFMNGKSESGGGSLWYKTR